MTTTILIIDDATHIRYIITRMLERAGYITLEATDGLEGLRILKENKPDLVTCDVSMPLMDGHEFLLAVRNSPEIQHIPIIIVTAIGHEEEAVKATDMGADAYLTKPFSSSSLIETIQTQLNKSKRTLP